MKKLAYLFCLMGLLASGNAYGMMPDLKLPFDAGLSWYMTRGYKTGTHIKYTNVDDAYALDFADAGCNFVNSPALATSAGKVVTAHIIDDNAYGKYVIIDHGGGYTSRYAHLNSVSVSMNESIAQGQMIGRVGSTGNVIGNCDGAHLHFALYYDNGVSKIGVKPEPMSGYTDFTAGKIYTSNNHYVRFNFNDGTSQGWSAGRDTQYIETSPDVWIVNVIDTDKDGVINPGVLSPVFGEGVTTDRFSKLQFIAKINTQPLGIQQGDVWIETPDGNWNHQFTFIQIADNGNSFHTYQASFPKGLIINQFSIELTKDNADEKWEFDEIDLMGRVSMPSGLMIK